jgi:hypothetical protein
MSGRNCKLRFTWNGDVPPRVGFFLKAPRGRTAYEIVAIRIKAQGPPMTGIFTVCRWEPSELPEHAVVCDWRWDRR